MHKSIEYARNTALSLMAIASLGQFTLERADAENPSPGNIVQQIDSLPPRPIVIEDNGVPYQTVNASATANNIKLSVYYIKPVAPNNPPLVRLTMSKDKAGQWVAAETLGEDDGTTKTFKEIDGRYAQLIDQAKPEKSAKQAARISTLIKGNIEVIVADISMPTPIPVYPNPDHRIFTSLE